MTPLNSPLNRVRIGLVVLVSVVVVATLGYHWGGDYSLVDSLWLVVITISTVGYGENSDMSDGMQLFTVGVILVGILAASYTFSGLVHLMVEGEIQTALGRRRMTREIQRLNQHVIICGYGRTGRQLAEGLQHEKVRFVIVDSIPENVADAQEANRLCILGDATEESVLREAGIESAAYLMSSLPSDADNVFITLTARNLNSQAEIICRAEQASTEAKLRQAGCNRVLMPTIVSARHMVRMITRPSTYDLMELVTESKFLDVELDEMHVSAANRLEGVTVAESEAHRRHRLLVVAIKQASGDMIFNPDAEYQFTEGDTLIMMGRDQDIEQFRAFYAVAE